MSKSEKKVPLAGLSSDQLAQMAAMAAQVAEGHPERGSTRWDRLVETLEFVLKLTKAGKVSMNELVFEAWKKLSPEARPNVLFQRRKHETLLIPVRDGTPGSVPLKVGKSGLVASCPGRNGFYQSDVPEAMNGTVTLKIEIRDETTEPQWKNCFAIPFKSAEAVEKKHTGNKGKKDKEGEQTTANKKTQAQKKTEQQQNTNTQQTTVHNQQNTDQNKAAAGQEGQG